MSLVTAIGPDPNHVHCTLHCGNPGVEILIILRMVKLIHTELAWHPMINRPYAVIAWLLRIFEASDMSTSNRYGQHHAPHNSPTM